MELELIEVDSTVTTVTVFVDRAQVKREIIKEFKEGGFIVKFSSLTASLDESSIIVNGHGEGIIKDVSIKKSFFRDFFSDELSNLLKQKEELEEKIKNIKIKYSIISKEKELIDNIIKRITTLSSQENRDLSIELDVQKWNNVINFYTDKLILLEEKISKASLEEKQLNKELSKLNNQINGYGNKTQEYCYDVYITIDKKIKSELELTLSYMIYNASWKPIYDIRVDSQSKTVDIIYNATITQNSGENWNKVKLNLSTAKPSIGGTHPKLYAWHIEKTRTIVPLNLNNIRVSKKVSSTKEHFIDKKEEITDNDIDNLSIVEPMKISQSNIENKISTALFSLSKNSDIPCDNTPHKVTIFINKFDALFRYSTTPKLSPFAYLQAKIINSSEYPLLKGETNIYLDNSFVATSNIDTVFSDEEFWIFLGADESLKIEYKRLKKFKEKVGILTKDEKITYEYLIAITNNKKDTINVIVNDQIPISDDKEIEVELLKPKYEKDTNELKINKEKLIEWNLDIMPKEKTNITLEYFIKYPENMEINFID